MTVGFSEKQANYRPTQHYDIPMETSDLTGWIKGLKAAAELQPEIIFVLSSDWGNVTTMDRHISYFLKKSTFEQYQQNRAELFLTNEDYKDEMDEYMEEFKSLHAAAIKMLELENQARAEAEMQPKIVRDWDEILNDNQISLPELPLYNPQESNMDISPVETRYTNEEVLESIFVIIMDNYRQKGFPKLNFVIFTAKNYSKNSTEAASLMTSDAKFNRLAKMVKGRFRYLKGMSKIDNLLDQDLDDVLDLLETQDP